MHLKNSLKVIGESPFFALFVITNLNQKGNSIEVMMITENIPIRATKAKECNAGCFAKIKEPIDRMVVKTASIIEVL